MRGGRPEGGRPYGMRGGRFEGNRPFGIRGRPGPMMRES